MRAAMQSKSNGRLQTRTRRIHSFEPCGPVAAMIANETRGKGRGAKSALYEVAVVALDGRKYPKSLARWQVLNEEANGKVVAA